MASALFVTAWWSILVYAVLVAAGGVVGYVKASSKLSLVSGLGSAVGLAIAWASARQNPFFGFSLAAAIALLLLIVFTVRFFKTRALMPAGLMASLSLVATILYTVSLVRGF